MDPLLLPVLMLGVGIIVVTLSMGAKQAAMIDGVWQAAAKALGGRYETLEPGTTRQLTAEIAGRTITIDHKRLRVGDQMVNCTRMRCAAEGPPELRLRVIPASGLAGLARAVGFQDVPVGDAGFDAEYVIKASDPEVAPLWLHAGVRRSITAVPDLRFKLERRRVEALCPYVIDEPDVLVAAAQAVASFADGRQRLAGAWKKLAREHGGKLELLEGGWARAEMSVEGIPVTVSTRDLRDKHFTEVTAESLGPALVPMVLSHEQHLHEAVLPIAPGVTTPEGYALYTREPAAYEMLFDAAIERALERLSPAKVRIDPHRVTVLIPGVEIRRARLRRAISLAVRLAGRAPSAPYR